MGRIRMNLQSLVFDKRDKDDGKEEVKELDEEYMDGMGIDDGGEYGEEVEGVDGGGGGWL